MAVAGIYRRILPSPPAVEFASSEGKQLFTEALQNGTMEGFFKLISHFQTQSEPAYCGLASLSMVLNALGVDPGRKWKGPWRWFDESMLDCCEPLEKVKSEGITFGKVVCLAHCAGVNVEAFRTSQSTLDEFRKHVIQCTSSEDCHVITSYYRKTLKQTGTGHFSPIGGYHEGRDMALILDVARFKYPPHWVPLSLLWEAMEARDEATGHPRGVTLVPARILNPYILRTVPQIYRSVHYSSAALVSRGDRDRFMLISRLHRAPSLLYTLSCRHESWVSTAKYLINDVPILLKSDGLDSVPDVLSLVFKSLLASAGEFIKWVAEVRRPEEGDSSLSKEEKERLTLKEVVLHQVRGTELFKYVTDWLSSTRSCCTNVFTLSDKDSLSEIAASVCRQGAVLLTGGLENRGFCCRATCVKCLKANGNEPITIVSGTVVSGDSEQGVDMLVPVSPSKSSHGSLGPSNCVVVHPASDDVLTVLLLALPADTWVDIKDEKLLAEIHGLVSTKRLPDVLQEEVLRLRRQLHFLRRCYEKEVDDLVLSS